MFEWSQYWNRPVTLMMFTAYECYVCCSLETYEAYSWDTSLSVSTLHKKSGNVTRKGVSMVIKMPFVFVPSRATRSRSLLWHPTYAVTLHCSIVGWDNSIEIIPIWLLMWTWKWFVSAGWNIDTAFCFVSLWLSWNSLYYYTIWSKGMRKTDFISIKLRFQRDAM